jgi:hypothetical protein
MPPGPCCAFAASQTEALTAIAATSDASVDIEYVMKILLGRAGHDDAKSLDAK